MRLTDPAIQELFVEFVGAKFCAAVPAVFALLLEDVLLLAPEQFLL